MAPEIYQGIVAYQSGDSTAAWTLVQKFTPLLKHYAFILHREDGFEDLQCYFLSLLKTLSLERLSSTSDGAIIKYIAISIRHEYIEQAKAKAKEGVVTYIDDLLLSQLPLNLCARANFFRYCSTQRMFFFTIYIPKYLIASVLLPFTCTSKCKWLPVARPVWPT